MSNEALAQPTDEPTYGQGAGKEKEEGGGNAPMMSSFIRRGEEKEGRMNSRAKEELTQTPSRDDHDDDHERERKPTFVTALSSAFAKHKAKGQPITSAATATPPDVAALVAAAGSRRPVSFERQHQRVTLHDKMDHFDGRRDLVERKDLRRNAYPVAAAVGAAGAAPSISGQQNVPEAAAIPKPWTLINTIGTRTSAAVASKKGNGVCNDSRSRRAPSHSKVSPAAKREASSASGISPGGGGGIRRWNLLNTETKAVKAFRKEQTSAAAAAAGRLRAGRRRWGGLNKAQTTTATFIRVLNAGCGYSDGETTSNTSSSSEDEGEERGSDRSRRRGRRGVKEIVGAGGSGSENSSLIWRESSDSDYNSSSDNSSFDEEVGGWASGRACGR